MKMIKRKVDKITRIAPFFCVCGCKRLVMQMEQEEQDGSIAVATCFKCGLELEHASDIESLKRKLSL